ncbi:MAG: hypothetical protein NTX63_00590 [Candidatus Peregrinibacteria bacterium]|nr:hypothetical protein [Candidatus Peregrinibacteria bacterium]
MKVICEISGRPFEVSGHEMSLREKFGFGDGAPKILPKYRFQYLGAFWPQWNLHKRKCDKTGEPIISVFRPDCVYPVWKRDTWIESSNPPSRDFDPTRPFFDQAWDLFQKCPIPHVFGNNNQNCEYADDWYYSKNCYLCHSGANNEDCYYSYESDRCKDIYYGVSTFDSELCYDLIASANCFNSLFLLDCKNVSDSAFMYDCRDCSDSLFCSNLRNKRYCFANEQLTKEEFEERKAQWDFTSHETYEKAKDFFNEMMVNRAWLRALQIDKSEDCSGNFIRESKDCENCYLLSRHENCANDCFSGPDAKSTLDSLGTLGGELVFMTSLPVYSYYATFSFSVSHCKFVEYCANLQNCQYCFGCCGLVNKKYCIFNKQYSKDEYEILREKIISHMKKTGEWGNFFPGYFAPNPYEESFSGFHFPVDKPSDLGFREGDSVERSSVKTAEIEVISDTYSELDSGKEKWLTEQIFWDESYRRSFRITKKDIDFAKKIKGPLPHNYYVHHLQDNFSWMPFNGELRDTVCAKSGKKIKTNWPEKFDGRILCEDEYLKVVK